MAPQSNMRTGAPRFGESVALSRDGTTLAIGFSRAIDSHGNVTGVVEFYRYDEDQDRWIGLGGPDHRIYGDQDGGYFGASASMSDDGHRVAVAAVYRNSKTGRVQVYEYNKRTDVWSQLGPSIDGKQKGDQFGYDLSMSGDGSMVAVGSMYQDNENGKSAGSVIVLKWKDNNSTWMPMGQELRGDQELDGYGSSVSLSKDGSRLAVGAKGAQTNIDPIARGGYARVYEYYNLTDRWIQVGMDDFTPTDMYPRFGTGVALSSNGSMFAVSSPNSPGFQHNGGYVNVYKEKTVLES